MALSTFMNNGQIPTGSAVTDMTTQTALPDWYTNYSMQVLANQQAAAQTPYQTYQGPRVAGMTPQQQQAAAMTGTAATAYQPGLTAAQGTAAQAAGASGLAAANPYFTQAQALDPSKTAAPSYAQAAGLYNTAAGQSAASAASPYITQGINTATGAVAGGGGLAAAQPYLTAAGGNATDVSAYMNPYTQNVVDRIAQLGTRNLTDSIMPALEGRYIKSGQFQGSGQMTDTMRAIRDTSNDILGQQSTALQQGYGAAQQASLADLARQAGLAGTAGNLGTAQQQAAMTLAQQQAAAGTTMGGFTSADQAAKMGAASGLTGLGTAGANLTAQQQQMLQNLGINVGGLTNTDTSNKANLAALQASLAGQQQSMGLTGAGALNASGAEQQKLNQSNLDVAYADFLKQQGYPQEQINNMVATMGAVGTKLPTTATQQGIGPSGVAAQYQPGTAQTIAGGLALGAGALGSFANTDAGKALMASLGLS